MKRCLGMALLFLTLISSSACTQEDIPPAPAVNTPDIVALYRSVLNDLYERDTALNDGIVFIAMDFTRAENLTQEEKDTLAQQFAEDTGLEVRFSTYRDLLDQRLIVYSEGTSSFTFFETGILFTFVTEEVEDGSFEFTADKWRSSLGAYGFSDCTATLRDGSWSYEIGSEFIS
ncbi:MAG: hypothetical protein H6Q61_153 [Firmicutes bacterium]|nr:hypothetical protein [Bacillota bacterium]